MDTKHLNYLNKLQSEKIELETFLSFIGQIMDSGPNLDVKNIIQAETVSKFTLLATKSFKVAFNKGEIQLSNKTMFFMIQAIKGRIEDISFEMSEKVIESHYKDKRKADALVRNTKTIQNE